MAKDRSYHETAIKYNATLAEAAEQLAPELEDLEIRKWCVSVGKQHRFHQKRHQSALDKILSREAETVDVEQISDGLDVPELVEVEEGVFSTGEEESVAKPVEEVELVYGESDTEATTATDISFHGEQTDSTVFEDGCIKFHSPALTTCEFNPNRVVTDA